MYLESGAWSPVIAVAPRFPDFFGRALRPGEHFLPLEAPSRPLRFCQSIVRLVRRPTLTLTLTLILILTLAAAAPRTAPVSRPAGAASVCHALTETANRRVHPTCTCRGSPLVRCALFGRG